MTNKARFELFAYWRTSATYRVRVAMNLKGIVPDERYINLDAGEQRSKDFLQINPLGAIPALIDREAPGPVPPITQSLAILEFLEDIHPAFPLLPADPYARARARAFAGFDAGCGHASADCASGRQIPDRDRRF